MALILITHDMGADPLKPWTGVVGQYAGQQVDAQGVAGPVRRRHAPLHAAASFLWRCRSAHTAPPPPTIPGVVPGVPTALS